MAKNILGHISRNQEEIVELLCTKSNYTCPTLPHYRYNTVQSICSELKKRGLVKKTGQTDTGINLVPTDLFRQWQNDFNAGKTTKGPIKYQKELAALNREPLKQRKCKCCGEEYAPAQINQKYCSKLCRKKKERPND